jgi:hypothetical protein
MAPDVGGGEGMSGDGATFSAQRLSAYFQSQRAGFDAQLAARLVEFIEATERTLDCAIYDLRHPRVVEALARLVANGKQLRIAFDAGKTHTGGLSGDPKPSGTQQALEGAGLGGVATPVYEHGRHLMHNKFLVRDGHAVWTGSANFTTGGLELQDNNCLVMESPELATAYTAVFEGLLHNDHRHAPALHDPVAVGDSSFNVSFAPSAGEGIENAIVAALNGARRVRVIAFLISDPGILDALAPFASDQRFDIRGVYDPHGMENVLRYTRQDPSRFWFTHDPRFVAAPSHAFDPSREQNFMHNKVFIVDDRLVLTGSYNFSENAESNDENMLAIESPALAAAYSAYFDALYATYGGTAAVPAGASDGHTHAHTHLAEREETTLADTTMAPRAHVFVRQAHGRVATGELPFANIREQFRGETEVGRTPHLIAYTDGSQEGTASAQAVLASAEADYAAVTEWFGGIQLPTGQNGDDQTTPRTATPVQVLIDQQAGGAYHFGCDATDLYIAPDAREATGLMVAELVEVFEAAINNGWSCGQANGEALSRALAVERNGSLAGLIAQTAQGWWASGHTDYVTNNNADDRNQDSNGCGTLFLYYLHSQLGFDWKRIVTTGGNTLGETYQKLTGKSGSEGFSDFVNRLATLDQGGQLSLPANGNPFPIGGAAQPPQTQPDPQGAPVPALPIAQGGSGSWVAVAVIAAVLLVLAALGFIMFH